MIALRFITGKLGRALVIAGGLLLAILTFAFGASKKREGRQEAVNEDMENANDLRDSVRNDSPDRVHQYDDAGWRD